MFGSVPATLDAAAEFNTLGVAVTMSQHKKSVTVTNVAAAEYAG